jgi:hypothetical protein
LRKLKKQIHGGCNVQGTSQSQVPRTGRLPGLD